MNKGSNTTIALTSDTKRQLDQLRIQLSTYFDTQVSYSFVVKRILEENKTLKDGRAV